MNLPGAGQHHNIISTCYTSKVHTQILQISILYWYVISHRGISTSGALVLSCFMFPDVQYYDLYAGWTVNAMEQS